MEGLQPFLRAVAEPHDLGVAVEDHGDGLGTEALPGGVECLRRGFVDAGREEDDALVGAVDGLDDVGG